MHSFFPIIFAVKTRENIRAGIRHVENFEIMRKHAGIHYGEHFFAAIVKIEKRTQQLVFRTQWIFLGCAIKVAGMDVLFFLFNESLKLVYCRKSSGNIHRVAVAVLLKSRLFPIV